MEFFLGCRTMLALMLFMASPLVNAAQCEASSGPQRVALLELYTSEGCSSCPPADRWLSSVAGQGLGPDRVIPLALHVDYWDYIGWPDRFARPVFSVRHREQVKAAGGRVVYTPQVMLNGQDVRDWRGNAWSRSVGEFNRLPAGADITLKMTSVKNNQIELQASAKTKTPNRGLLYVAVFQNGLSSDVRAGENRGVRLQHDYVVREWYGPIDLSTTSAWQQSIVVKQDWNMQRMGVAAFVQGSSNGDILQALQLPFCSS